MTDKTILNQVMRDQVQPQNAIRSLAPGSAYKLEKDGKTFVYFRNKDGLTQPTEDEIDAEIIRLQAEYDAQEYARNRATAYPALADQLDEIYHNGIDSWKAVIKVTKDKYPKG